MSVKSKLEQSKEAFELWMKLAITRVGLAAVAVPEDKKETLNVLLESAFEAGFSVGCQTGMHDVMSDLMDHAKKNGKDTDAIMMPGVGHA